MHQTTTQQGAARANTLDIVAAFIGDNGTRQAGRLERVMIGRLASIVRRIR